MDADVFDPRWLAADETGEEDLRWAGSDVQSGLDDDPEDIFTRDVESAGTEDLKEKG